MNKLSKYSPTNNSGRPWSNLALSYQTMSPGWRTTVWCWPPLSRMCRSQSLVTDWPMFRMADTTWVLNLMKHSLITIKSFESNVTYRHGLQAKIHWYISWYHRLLCAQASNLTISLPMAGSLLLTVPSIEN